MGFSRNAYCGDTQTVEGAWAFALLLVYQGHRGTGSGQLSGGSLPLPPPVPPSDSALSVSHQFALLIIGIYEHLSGCNPVALGG